ncbi:hypothetical protein BWQ96_05779 [Gracilariopsis chorda]|uniref:VWFA domain-containing protein n=1 Tax=Gracilariopsis chorda TaxID=448386 RepID=A0A2V3IQR0_9FLOR|nr:hypothetical protein BWQ96_05779 [Gracilariopsis chorda]|eukprot:PXF44451.1 hypothetical protein BWQ96_05779 [Gracilariopsis chorda]
MIFLKFISFILLLSLSLSTTVPQRDPLTEPWKSLLEARTQALTEDNTVAKELGESLVLKIQQNIVRHGKCDSRSCFAIDGSASISPSAFQFQKDLVKLLASFAALDDEAEFSAVQYGLANRPISLETSNITEFLTSLETAKQANASRTFIGAGIATCIRRIRRGEAESAKGTIFVLGDGQANFALGFLDEVLAEVKDERLVAVGFGNVNRSLLETIAGTDQDSVFLLPSYADFHIIIYSLLLNICSFCNE